MNLNTAMTCCSAGRLDEWMELAGSSIPPQEEQQQPPRYEEYITVKQQWMAQVRDWGRGTSLDHMNEPRSVTSLATLNYDRHPFNRIHGDLITILYVDAKLLPI